MAAHIFLRLLSALESGFKSLSKKNVSLRVVSAILAGDGINSFVEDSALHEMIEKLRNDGRV